MRHAAAAAAAAVLGHSYSRRRAIWVSDQTRRSGHRKIHKQQLQ